MVVLTYVVNLLLFIVCLTKSKTAQGAMTNTQRGDFQYLPLVVNTWPFTNATSAGWSSITSGGSSLDAVELGCSTCEQEQCDGSVGFGNHPDETGETTLDAMIMDGVTHDVGSVGCLRRVKSAISVARAVMNYTKHTLLVGELATQFAVEMGFKEESLSTNTSIDEWRRWKDHNCQPNFRQNVKPDPTKSCGPYHPFNSSSCHRPRYNEEVTRGNHDTIGMIVVDKNGNIAGGTTTNGANHKVPGRVGDSPIVGAGCYVDNNIGGAVATGDGDVMMRFLPSLRTVENMKQGMSPSSACEAALQPIIKYYPDFSGAVVAASKQGIHDFFIIVGLGVLEILASIGYICLAYICAACYGFDTFHYSAYFTGLKSPKIEAIPCMQKTK